jgi:formamidopyrimidine-DNA glycosylase
MPELPEVETVTNSIKNHLIYNCFTDLQINWTKTLHNFSFYDFESQIKNIPIQNVFRKGKYIIIDFFECILAVHLRMTGKLYVVNYIEPDKKHISIYMQFNNKYLIFEDTRKFGRFYLYNNLDYLNQKLGVEPLSIDFSKNWFFKTLKARKRQIKSFLLDQSFICGIGNIYADEALWHAKINPLSISNKIPRAKINNLHEAIIKVLKESIKKGGTTIRDYTYNYSYVGNYALNLKVYSRKGKLCFNCKSIIVKIVVAQRGTHYCPNCQKK